MQIAGLVKNVFLMAESWGWLGRKMRSDLSDIFKLDKRRVYEHQIAMRHIHLHLFWTSNLQRSTIEGIFLNSFF